MEISKGEENSEGMHYLFYAILHQVDNLNTLGTNSSQNQIRKYIQKRKHETFYLILIQYLRDQALGQRR